MDNKDWSPEAYKKNASYVFSREFTTPVLNLLDVQPGERVIDFGCGSGELTKQLQDVVGQDGLVVGVDASKNMVI